MRYPTVSSVSQTAGRRREETAVTITGTKLCPRGNGDVRRDGGDQRVVVQHLDHGHNSGGKRRCGNGDRTVSGQSGSLTSGFTYAVIQR